MAAKKDDPTTPGAEGADEQAKVEQEAAESKQAEAQEAATEEKPKRTRRKKADAEAAAEEKPKPRRRTTKKAEPKAEEAPEEVKQEDAAKEAEAEEAEVEGKPEPEDEKARPKPASRRRGGEVTAGRTPRRSAGRRSGAAPDVTVRAKAKYVRCAPRKARLVVDHIRGKRVDEARAILRHTQRAAATDVLKLLESAIANAENNHELVADELHVARAYVDEGPTLKRYRPRALGRATRIRKRTSHLTIELAAKE